MHTRKQMKINLRSPVLFLKCAQPDVIFRHAQPARVSTVLFVHHDAVVRHLPAQLDLVGARAGEGLFAELQP